MPTSQERIEVERIVNLVTGFGWVKEKEELSDDDIKITLSKKRKKPETPGIST